MQVAGLELEHAGLAGEVGPEELLDPAEILGVIAVGVPHRVRLPAERDPQPRVHAGALEAALPVEINVPDRDVGPAHGELEPLVRDSERARRLGEL